MTFQATNNELQKYFFLKNEIRIPAPKNTTNVSSAFVLFCVLTSNIIRPQITDRTFSVVFSLNVECIEKFVISVFGQLYGTCS